jgi:hypothetical protein
VLAGEDDVTDEIQGLSLLDLPLFSRSIGAKRDEVCVLQRRLRFDPRNRRNVGLDRSGKVERSDLTFVD